MTRVAVDLDRLADLIDQLASFHAHLTRARARVDARVRDAGWTGDAAAAAAAAQARWEAGAVEVHEALAALRSVAATAQANYTAAMIANRRMWSG